ncbi:hypothetical protein, partial [Streptomyces sp. RP5T]|uniref:hypothetical protein n=1 Tax=Streptomyces sp. RP5T TaxID=2490848 RepID=UPI001C8C5CAC
LPIPASPSTDGNGGQREYTTPFSSPTENRESTARDPVDYETVRKKHRSDSAPGPFSPPS